MSHRIKGWYRDAVNCAPPPARNTLERITTDQVELYIYVPPLGANIRISVELSPVNDLVPTKDEIEESVKNLQRNRSGEASGMRAEHLKGWLAESKRKKR